MRRIYLDAAPIIYLIEKVTPYYDGLTVLLGDPEVVLVSSELTRMECREKPLREGSVAFLQDFDEFFSSSVSEIVPLQRDVMDEATRIRATYGFKTPDAIHLAAAIVSQCNAY